MLNEYLRSEVVSDYSTQESGLLFLTQMPDLVFLRFLLVMPQLLFQISKRGQLFSTVLWLLHDN